jgi:excisionase family DNA binding protein
MTDLERALDLPAVLTVDELAALLRVDRKTLYTAVRNGEIPGTRRIGRTIRFSRDTVLRWLADGQGHVPRSRRNR